MADPHVEQATDKFAATIGSTAVTAGDMVYFDGTDWELADADDNTKYAEAVAVNSYASGDVGVLCRSGIIRDTDAPYTQGNTMYLSATAGEITATRPTGAENLMQVVGNCIDTSRVIFEIKAPYEITVNLSPMTDGTAAYSQYGDFTGVLLAAASEAGGYTFMVPQNTVGNVIQYLWWSGVGTALDASDTYTIDVSSGVDDETTTTTTDGITAAALTVASADINRADVSAAFDGTGIIKPGNVVAVDVDKAAEGSGGDDALLLCCSVVLLVV
jgi:hypothetical protein